MTFTARNVSFNGNTMQVIPILVFIFFWRFQVILVIIFSGILGYPNAVPLDL
jgi:hypothetical protein